MEEAIKILKQARINNHWIFVCGNGGSASTSSHFVCDLIKRAGYRAIGLTDNVAVLTAYTNDINYEKVFSEPLKVLGREGDVLVAISASGTSKNVLKAVNTAREMKMKTIGLVGFKGGKLKFKVDCPIHFVCDDMRKIEDEHLRITHEICERLR
jgi:D-sedoheptulose 7-phosphate isomerase